MDVKQIIISNLKAYRQKLGYTQEDLAKFIGIDRTLISHYENGTREITLVHMNKFADLFGIEADDFLVNNSSEIKANLAFAFRSDGMEKEDLSSIAEFQKIVKNYIKMTTLAKSE